MESDKLGYGHLAADVVIKRKEEIAAWNQAKELVLDRSLSIKQRIAIVNGFIHGFPDGRFAPKSQKIIRLMQSSYGEELLSNNREYIDFNTSEDADDMSYIEYKHISSRTYRNWGIVLTMFSPAPMAVSWGVVFSGMMSGSIPEAGGWATFASLNAVGMTTLVCGIVLWTLGQRRMDQIEVLIASSSNPIHSQVEFVGLLPLLGHSGSPSGAAMSFTF